MWVRGYFLQRCKTKKEDAKMAIFYVKVNMISRSSGRSSVAASAYRSGEKIKNEYDGLIHDYRNKSGVVYSEILLPENAPERFENRATLWNEVEQIEKGKNAQLSREIVLALPIELNQAEQIQLTQDYVKNNFVKDGMIADVNIHDKEDGNPHAHIMLTVRSLDEHGEWQAKQKKDYILDKEGNKQYDPVKKTYKCRTIKTTNWDEKEKLLEWRENWAKEVNQVFQNKGIVEQIDHRSYKEQGSEKIPQIHMGHEATAMERRGIKTYKGNINRSIVEQNETIKKLGQKINGYTGEIQKSRESRESASAKQENRLEPPKMAQKPIEQSNAKEVRQNPKKATEPKNTVQERRSLTSKERAVQIKERQDLYLSIEKRQEKLEKDQQKYFDLAQSFSVQAKSLPKEFERIDQIAINHDQLNDEIQSLQDRATFFHTNKKEITSLQEQKKSLAQSYHQAVAKFEKKWKIPFKNKTMKEKVKHIKADEKKAKEILANIQQKLKLLEEQRQIAILEYKTELFIAEMLPHSQEILEQFEKLRTKGSEARGEKRSILGKLNEYKNGLINDIDRKNVIEYQKKINPKLAKRLEEYFEKTAIQKQEEQQMKKPSQDRGFER